jgi:hypothetical protein
VSLLNLKKQKKMNLQNVTPGNETATSNNAFQYLSSLPHNEHKVKTSATIDHNLAQTFTDAFRITDSAFTIPVSWSLTKASLLSLLGITSHEGYEDITGVRFYAGLNDNLQLTLIAVSTEADPTDAAKNNDLTIDDQYPYFDYADPCPSHCSNSGNLRLQSIYPTNMNFQRVV